MKNITLILSLFALLTACKNNPENQQVSADEVIDEIAFASFGDAITEEQVLSKEEMLKVYENLKPGDTVAVKFRSTVNQVCQSKGCWMRLDLGELEAMVKFKDYGFFVPKNIAGDEVIVDGIAFIEDMSVGAQRHYARDARGTEDEIETITETKQTFSFEAKGVLLIE